ncbi:MAG: hypothetical protein ACI4S4_02680, partial [Candidatus Ornithospirochaeta sp.]
MKRIVRPSYVLFVVLIMLFAVSCASTKKSADIEARPVESQIEIVEVVQPKAEVSPQAKVEPVEAPAPDYGIVSFSGDELVARVNGHSVTFDLSGGVFKNNPLDLYNSYVASAAAVVPLPEIEKKGFEGFVWKDDKGNEVKQLDVTALSSDVVFTAQWIEKAEDTVVINYSCVIDGDSIFVTINGHTITLRLNGGILPKDALEFYTALAESGKTTIPLPSLAKIGYGECTWKDAEGNTVEEVDVLTLSSDVAFTAEYGDAIKYPLTYDEGGVLYEPEPVAEVPVEEVVVEEPVPEEEEKEEYISFYTIEDEFVIHDLERQGYDFKGWI